MDKKYLISWIGKNAAEESIYMAETDEEAESGIMRLWVLANRTGLQDRGCGISLNLQVGQFAIDSWRI